MSYILGIDPGMSGAVAIMSKAGWIVHDCPKEKAQSGFRSDVKAMADLIRFTRNTGSRCVIEHVHARPGEGVSSTFKFGQNYGAWLGILHAYEIDTYVISPNKWKRAMNLEGLTKDDSLTRARELCPHLEEHLARKKDHNRAEAILLAHFAIAIPH